jgi:hypothetical protein
VLVELVLFIGYHRERWRKALLPRNNSSTQDGHGLVIRSDGHGYYAWLRSLLLDGDWSFDNEFDEHNPLGDWVPPATRRTERGLRANPWSVGPACVWAVPVVPAHLCLTSLPGLGPHWRADGYTLPYQLLVGGTTVLASFLGLGFLYAICRHFARPSRAALAAALLVLGTPVVFYSAIEVAMAHGVGAAAVAGLVWYWLRTYGEAVRGRWFLVGLLVGVAALMRWQLATFALLPAGESVLQCRRAGWTMRPLLGLAAAGLGALIGFLPQVVAWQVVYGHWLATPTTPAHNWLDPAWGRVLLSTDRGLFSWTPLTLLALLGLGAGTVRSRSERTEGSAAGKWEPLALLLAAFMVQVYVVASLLGEEVWLGVSFGFRFLTEAGVALAPGLALLLERARGRWLSFLGGLGCVLVLGNLLLICQYRYGLVPAAGGAEPAALLANVGRLVARKKGVLIGQALAAPALLWLLRDRPDTGQRGTAVSL